MVLYYEPIKNMLNRSSVCISIETATASIAASRSMFASQSCFLLSLTTGTETSGPVDIEYAVEAVHRVGRRLPPANITAKSIQDRNQWSTAF